MVRGGLLVTVAVMVTVALTLTPLPAVGGTQVTENIYVRESRSRLRNRRQTADSDGLYQVEVSFPAQSGPVTNEDTQQAADVQKLIKDIILEQGEFNVQSQLPHVKQDPSSLQLDSEYVCEEGKVLVDRWCVACAAGTYFDGESRTCRKCPIGTYQNGEGQTSCTPCPHISGKQSTTAMRGTQTPDLCKERCVAGRYFDSTMQLCKACGVGRYQSRAGQFSCYQCDRGLTTRSDESTSAEDCTAACESGHQLSDDNTCQPCPRGTYRSAEAQQTCLACAEGTTTLGTGATLSDDCALPVCQPGTFLNTTEGNRCQSCPLATYQPARLQTSCLDCPPDTTTQQVGSTAASQCTNPCDGDGGGRAACDTHANCLLDARSGTSRCECRLGFSGDGANCTDRCHGFCDNAGVCSKDERTGLPACACVGSFTGERCVEKSQFAYIAGGVAGFVLVAIICVLFVWMICARANKKRQSESAAKAMTLPPDAASQVNFYYGAPTPYAESIAPSHHSNYAHYYDEEDEAWEMPNFYNEAFVRDGGKMGTLPHSSASMYGGATKQDELYDRLRKHAYTGKREMGENSDGQDDQAC